MESLSSCSLHSRVCFGLQGAMSVQVITHLYVLELPPNKNLGVQKMAMDVLLCHVSFSIFSGYILSTTVSACLCTGLGYKWFLNESPDKYQLCEAPDVQFCFFEALAQRCQFNSTIITGVVFLCSAACTDWGSDTFCIVLVLQQMELK